jgi:tripartite-type tricarboxylate transporter receptor subunit TctC
MAFPRRQFLHGAAAALGLSALPRLACAQLYPSRPITLVVPFPAGGPVDTLARFLAERMRASLGQPLVIENISGAGGSIGVGRVARASPEGYTLILGITSTHVFNGAMYPLQYDVLNDFEPVALVTDSSQLIVGRKNLPPTNLPELIAWLRANPDKTTSATAGVGSPHHIFGVLFQTATGTRSQFAHYRGAAPATQDLVAGQIHLAIADQVTTLPQIRAGNIKVYAFTGKSRLPLLALADEVIE